MPPSSRSPNIRTATLLGIAARQRWALRELQQQRAALSLPEAEPLLPVEAALYKGQPHQPHSELRRPR